MPAFNLSTKSNWNSSKKRGRPQRGATKRKGNNKFTSTNTKRYNNNNNNNNNSRSKFSQKKKNQNQPKSQRQKNSGSDAAIRPMNTLNSSKYKPKDAQKNINFEQSRRSAKVARRKALLARKQHMTKAQLEAPKSFIVTRGKVTKNCQMLKDDLRAMFSPYTALKLKV